MSEGGGSAQLKVRKPDRGIRILYYIVFPYFDYTKLCYFQDIFKHLINVHNSWGNKFIPVHKCGQLIEK